MAIGLLLLSNSKVVFLEVLNNVSNNADTMPSPHPFPRPPSPHNKCNVLTTDSTFLLSLSLVTLTTQYKNTN
jgi:hypothetical protein